MDCLEKMKNIEYFISVMGGVISYLLGGWDILIATIIIFMILDYITGMSASWISKSWSSEIGYKGLLKKGMIIVMIIISVRLDNLLGDDMLFRNVVTFFYISNEGISIVENCGKLGLPIPSKIKTVLEQLKEENNG